MTVPQLGPYATGVSVYQQLGWPSAIPCDLDNNGAVPEGFTGRKNGALNRWPTLNDLGLWAVQYATKNIGLRVPPNVIGLDIDAYSGKLGGDTIRSLESHEDPGPLPATWSCTSRGQQSESRKKLFLVPAGLEWQSSAGPHVDVIQTGHRWVRCWPSVAPRTGAIELWYRPDGTLSDRPPRPDELAVLPMSWVHYLSKKTNVSSNGHSAVGTTKLSAKGFADLVTRAVEKVEVDHEARHDAGWWLACQLRDNRYSKADAQTVLEMFRGHVQKLGERVIDDGEVLRWLNDVFAKEPRDPSIASSELQDIAVKLSKKKVKEEKVEPMVDESPPHWVDPPPGSVEGCWSEKTFTGMAVGGDVFTYTYGGKWVLKPAGSTGPEGTWERFYEPGTEPVPPKTYNEVENVYIKWLGAADLIPLRAVMAVAKCNLQETGEPVNLFCVGGSGVGKTEMIMPLGNVPLVHMVSALTGEAALLSGVSKKDEADNSTGGLLRQIGHHGMLIIKDFTTILSMRADSRQILLSAFREIADGKWSRHYGTDGGKVLEWSGKLGMIAGTTTSIDSEHGALLTMGARWLFIRVGEDVDRDALALRAMANVGHEEEMRTELVAAVRGLLQYGESLPAHTSDGTLLTAIYALANFTTLARSPVDHDYRGNLTLVHDAEAPTRVAKALVQVWQGCGMIGLSRVDSWAVVTRVADDSIPKLRRLILHYLVAQRFSQPSATVTYWQSLINTVREGNRPTDNPQSWYSSGEIALVCKHPTMIVLRELEALRAHGLVEQTFVTATDEKNNNNSRPYWWRLTENAANWAWISKFPWAFPA